MLFHLRNYFVRVVLIAALLDDCMALFPVWQQEEDQRLFFVVDFESRANYS